MAEDRQFFLTVDVRNAHGEPVARVPAFAAATLMLNEAAQRAGESARPGALRSSCSAFR